MDKKLVNCNSSKMILMLIIVFYHSIAFWKGDWFTVIGTPVYDAKGLKYLAKWMSYIHNSCFVLISGYIYCYIRVEKEKYNDFKLFFLSKLKRLIVPCYFGILITIPFAIHYYNYNIVQIINNYILGESPSHMWFLMMLFWIFILAYFFTPIWLKNQFLSIVIVISIYVLGTVVDHFVGGYFQISNSMHFLSAFYIGFIIRRKWVESEKLYKILIFIVLDLIFYILLELTLAVQNNSVLLMGIEYILKFINVNFGAVMMFMVLQYLSEHVELKTKLSKQLIKCSMPIYIFHHSIVWMMISAFNGSTNPYLHATLTFVISIGISLSISLIFFKWKGTRFLIGEKI